MPGGIETCIFYKKCRERKIHSRDSEGGVVLLEVGANILERPGDMAFDGQRGQMHLAGNLRMAHAGHLAEDKDKAAVQLRGEVIHRFLQWLAASSLHSIILSGPEADSLK